MTQVKMPEPSYYAVFDEDGVPVHLTIHPMMAQDHINNALDRGYDDAAKWVSRAVYTESQLQAYGDARAAEKDALLRQVLEAWRYTDTGMGNFGSP